MADRRASTSHAVRFAAQKSPAGWRDGWLARSREITRLKDENGDGRAGLLRQPAQRLPANGDCHEYAFGSDYDDGIWSPV